MSTERDALISNMILTQLITVNIRESLVISRMSSVYRDEFVPEAFKSIAYSSKSIPLSNDKSRFMLEPAIAGRFLQQFDLDFHKNALIVADASGYFSSLISLALDQLTFLEKDEEAVNYAREKIIACDAAKHGAFDYVAGDLTKGAPQNAPYDIIFIHGAIKKIPDEYYDQLSEKGQIFTALIKDKICHAVSSYKDEEGNIQTNNLFECFLEPLPEFKVAPSFKL